MKVTDLSIYPVKSLRGVPLGEATVEPRGLAGDRRWMVVDEAGRFLTRRTVPAMALLEARLEAGGLRLSHPDLGVRHVAVPGRDAPVIDAVVWRDTVCVRPVDRDVDAFLGAALGRPARLVHQVEESRRPIDPRYASADQHVSLADGFPLLLTSEASLAALNDRLATPVPMERFRPNLVIAGAEAWAEDRWRTLRIGGATLRIARASARCIVVTQQPLTGERLEGNEPLSTLRAMGRKDETGVLFGQNAIPLDPGKIRVGDHVEVVEEIASEAGEYHHA